MAITPARLATINIFIILIVEFICYGQFAMKINFFLDDYEFYTRYFDYQNFGDLFKFSKTRFTFWPLGRPLGVFVSDITGYFAAFIGSHHLLQVLGQLIVFINCILIYFITYSYIYIANDIKKFYIAATSALFSALIYLTFPGDLLKNWITAQVHIQPGLTCCLLAMLLFQKIVNYHSENPHSHFSPKIFLKWFPVYFIGSLSLLFYETTFMPFLMAPALTRRCKDFKLYIKHFIILFIIICVYAYIRQSMGDSRLDKLNINFDFFIFYLKNIMYGIYAIPYSYYTAFVDNSLPIDYSVFYLGILFLCGVYFMKKFLPQLPNLKFSDGLIILCFIPAGYLFYITRPSWGTNEIDRCPYIAEAVIFAFIWIYFINVKKLSVILYPLSLVLTVVSIIFTVNISNNYVKLSEMHTEIAKGILNKIQDFTSDDKIIFYTDNFNTPQKEVSLANCAFSDIS